ncbi:MAG TPA: Spy/CpxP family protein refolding chaperone [Thermoanaerobaculia bacterium]
MKIRQSIASGICAALLLAGAALAQGHHGHVAGTAGMDGMAEHLAKALNLTDAQKAQAKQIHQDLMAKMTPLLQQSKQQHQELETLLNGVNPDAAEIGQKTIAAHATRAQIKALHDDAKTRFSALLTPAQKTKFEQMMQQTMGHHWGGGSTPDAPPADN